MENMNHCPRQFLNNDNNDYQDDIVLTNPQRFHPKLPQEEIDKLDEIFCVDSLENTRCFSINAREIRVVKKYRDLFNLKEGYTTNDIIETFKDQKMIVVRRKKINGIKQDNIYVAEEGLFVSIEDNRRYDCTNIIININNINEEVGACRVFFSK